MHTCPFRTALHAVSQTTPTAQASCCAPLSRRFKRQVRQAGFTLVELLLVIAIISILAAMVISSFSDAAQTSREVVVRQQLAVWQSALNNWVNGKLGRIDSTIDAAKAPITVETLRTFYNARTKTQRFTLIAGVDLDASTSDFEAYLEPKTADTYRTIAQQQGAANMDKIRSDAMVQTGRWLDLPTWQAGNYPTVQILP